MDEDVRDEADNDSMDEDKENSPKKKIKFNNSTIGIFFFFLLL